MPPGEGWTEYRAKVLAEIERHEDWLKTIEERITSLRIAQAKLQVKCGLLGTLAGVLTAALVKFLSA